MTTHFIPTPVKSPQRLRLDELLADGKWHTYEEVVRVVARAVEPGKAARTAERQRQRRAAGLRVRGDETTAVATGQRRKANDALSRAVRDGKVERDGDRVRAVVS